MAECPYHCTNGKVLLEALGTKVPCPHCNGVERYVAATSPENPDNVYNTLHIPIQYRHLTGNSAAAMISALRGVKDSGCDALEVANFMETVSNNLDMGKVFRMSTCLHISGSGYFDLNVFVYSMQLKALKNGVGTMPYITANTLDMLIKGGSLMNKPVMPAENSEEMGITGRTVPLLTRLLRLTDFDYYDYITAPLVFIELGTATTIEGNAALAELLSERSKLGLATYVISCKSMHNTRIPFAYNLIGQDMSRLDRMVIVEYVRERPRQMLMRTFEGFDVQRKDSESNYGIKEPGMSAREQSSLDE